MASRNGCKPKIALVLPAWHEAGPLPLYWAQILEALDGLDVQTEVIVAKVHPLVNREQPPAERRALLPSAAFVRTLLSSSAPTLLCVEYNVATALCLVVARARGKRAIIFQEHRGREGLQLPRWEQAYHRVLAALAHGVVANTDAAFAELTEVLRIDPRKIFRATLLVPPQRAALSQETSFAPTPSRRPLFLFVGKLVRRKNVDGLISASAALRARGFEFEVWIVGDGPERAALERQAAELIDERVIRFIGSRAPTAIGQFYEIADVFVMPSVRDYRSVAVLEALRFGTPVIDSAKDGNAGDFVRHELTGLIFEPEQQGALARAMERVLLDPELFREMGKRAAELLDGHTPQQAATSLLEIVDAVATKERGSREPRGSL